MTPEQRAEKMHSIICYCHESNCPRVALVAAQIAEARQEVLEQAAKIVQDEIDQVRYPSLERAIARIRALKASRSSGDAK